MSGRLKSLRIYSDDLLRLKRHARQFPGVQARKVGEHAIDTGLQLQHFFDAEFALTEEGIQAIKDGNILSSESSISLRDSALDKFHAFRLDKADFEQLEMSGKVAFNILLSRYDFVQENKVRVMVWYRQNMPQILD